MLQDLSASNLSRGTLGTIRDLEADPGKLAMGVGGRIS